MSAADARRLDLLAIDHMPTCPDCGDLCPTGSTVCDGCGTHLLVSRLLGRIRPAGRDPVSDPAEQTWACPNCLREWREPYCDECSRNLMEAQWLK